MLKLIPLLHSSAAVERTSPQTNLAKTRNKVNSATLNEVLQAKATFDTATCYDFKIHQTPFSKGTEERSKALKPC